MANAAAKKAAKAGAAASNKAGLPIAAAVGLFLLYRCAWGYSTLGWMHILAFLFQIIALVVAYFGMIEAAKNASFSELYADLYYVTLASVVLSSFTDWGFYLLLLIPVYGSYLAYNLWKSNPMSSLMGEGGQPAAADDVDAADAGKKEKKRKVKYGR